MATVATTAIVGSTHSPTSLQSPAIDVIVDESGFWINLEGLARRVIFASRKSTHARLRGDDIGSISALKADWATVGKDARSDVGDTGKVWM